MTVNSRASKSVTYKTEKDKAEEAAKELNMASDLAEYIYNSRQLPPNESQLIKNFYYSIYHLVKAISVLDTGIEYKSHSSLISYFNREIKHDDFLKKYNVNISDISNIGNELNTLFIFRDNYDYREAAVDEEDYEEAERIWLNLYPKLENIVMMILNSMKE
ncbi:MAG: HEPN domain-containing protein [Lachnospiraceae bacterium]|nr:HEPN domain-containing protein [Lachnospiraceae bacterium]